jgi:hypothetical protein
VTDLVVDVELGAGDGSDRINPPGPSDCELSAIFDGKCGILVLISQFSKITWHLICDVSSCWLLNGVELFSQLQWGDPDYVGSLRAY